MRLEAMHLVTRSMHMPCHSPPARLKAGAWSHGLKSIMPQFFTCAREGEPAPDEHKWLGFATTPSLGAPQCNGNSLDAERIKHEGFLECGLFASSRLPTFRLLEICTITRGHDLHFTRGVCPVHTVQSQSNGQSIANAIPAQSQQGYLLHAAHPEGIL